MKTTKKILVKGTEILFFGNTQGDYISLTDIARYKNAETTGLVISHWLSTRYTVEFLGIWEQIHNPNFNVTEFSDIKNQSGSNGFVLSGKQWIEKTNALGIISKPGRYGGGTYAHKDIAFEFASWISAEFKLYLIKEFQRLKEEENERLTLGWDVKRVLTKVNYRVHTDAIKKHLIPALLGVKSQSVIYATEADVLNVALFGMTAKTWREKNLNTEGNIRDEATIEQLVVLANLESLNAEFIRQKLPQSERLVRLNEIAIIQMSAILGSPSLGEMKKLKGEV
ncbi:MAG: KilA-N domain-containing protein [Candidatus Gracilibacteria bacterium]|nr:KilA-N domain-containing protein [Candidatus Gracilibacteria bacterium]